VLRAPAQEAGRDELLVDGRPEIERDPCGDQPFDQQKTKS